MSVDWRAEHGRRTDQRLRRAVPAFNAAAPARAPRDDPGGVGGTWALALRAWPYIWRYVGGRWIGLGAAAGGPAPGAAGLLYMPILVTALAVASFALAGPTGAPTRAAAFWMQVGHGLGASLALVAWATWLARGRLRTVLGLAGAVLGLLAAVLTWLAEPGLAGRALGVALLGAYLAGAALRLKVRRKLGLWLRIESHLVYYYGLYAVCTFIIALNTAFLTDLLYQSILIGKPMMEGFAGLIGHPEMAHAGAGGPLSLGQRQTLQVWYFGCYFAGFLFSVPTIYIGLPYYWTYIHQVINQNLRVDLMDHWHRLSPRYHSSHRVGDSIYRIFLDSAQISNIISRLQISFLSATGWITACFVALFFDWRIAALLFGIAAPTLAFASWYTPRLKRYALASREATSDLTSRAQEILTGVRVIKAYGQEDREQARFEADSVTAFDAAFRLRWLFVLIGVAAFTIGALFLMPAIYLMATWASAGRATMAAGLIALVGLSFSK